MNSKPRVRLPVLAAAAVLAFGPGPASAYEIFIHRLTAPEFSLARSGRIALDGELFAWQCPSSTMPGYNDMTGPVDRWNFGFQDRVLITPTTDLLVQMLCHDDGRQRTKFDWHFHLRQTILPHLVLIIGHDSDHDAEHLSRLRGKPYYRNRNSVGLGAPVEGRGFFFEPFVRFFHHTNHRVFLDLSGERVAQEYGLQAALRPAEGIGVHAQAFAQTDKAFTPGRMWVGEVLVKLELAAWLELTGGWTLWSDRLESPLGGKARFHKLFWGIAVPF